MWGKYKFAIWCGNNGVRCLSGDVWATASDSQISMVFWITFKYQWKLNAMLPQQEAMIFVESLKGLLKSGKSFQEFFCFAVGDQR